MKKRVFLIVGFLVAAVFVLFESYHQTAADLYQESYAAQMRKQMGYSGIADDRAEQYRKLYEVCDKQHNCTSASGQAPARIKG